MNLDAPSVCAIFILDSDGNRICAKYYDSKRYPTLPDQVELEQKLHSKAKNTNARNEAEIITFDQIVTVFRFGGDTTLYVVGALGENEIILSSILEGAYDTISGMLRGHMDRSVMLENLELILLTFDEVVDGGIILETDSQSITNRVLMRGIDNDVPLSELTISQALASAREQFSRSFRS